jgi:hypothetical protein
MMVQVRNQQGVICRHFTSVNNCNLEVTAVVRLYTCISLHRIYCIGFYILSSRR